MKTQIISAVWIALVIMAVPIESQGRAAGGAVKPSPSTSPQSHFTATVRDAVLDSLKQSLATLVQHHADSDSIKDAAMFSRRSIQAQAERATNAALQQAQQTAVGSGPDAVKKLLEAERFARAKVAQIGYQTLAPEWAVGWRKAALDLMDQAIAKTTQALGQ
jgi:hypothetical protein